MKKYSCKAFTLAEVFSTHSVGYRKLAFTLAEVLITLGIIGVVAAMTLPTLINNNKNKQLETAFKKSYAMLSQAVQATFLNEYGGARFDEAALSGSSVKIFINNIQKYYKKSYSCHDGRTNCPKSVFPLETFNSNASVDFLKSNYKNYNASRSGYGYCNDGILAANDGSFVFFDVSSAPGAPENPLGESTYGKLFVCIDTNGWRKKPNRFGHDFFIFQVNLANGKLLPMGADGTEFPENTYCSKTSTSANNGFGCTIKAFNEKDYFKNLPK